MAPPPHAPTMQILEDMTQRLASLAQELLEQVRIERKGVAKELATARSEVAKTKEEMMHLRVECGKETKAEAFRVVKHVESFFQKKLEEYNMILTGEEELIREMKEHQQTLQNENARLSEELAAMRRTCANEGLVEAENGAGSQMVQMLVERLKEEKKNRLQAEEQANQLVSQQEETIVRLEMKLKGAEEREKRPRFGAGTPTTPRTPGSCRLGDSLRMRGAAPPLLGVPAGAAASPRQPITPRLPSALGSAASTPSFPVTAPPSRAHSPSVLVGHTPSSPTGVKETGGLPTLRRSSSPSPPQPDGSVETTRRPSSSPRPDPAPPEKPPNIADPPPLPSSQHTSDLQAVASLIPNAIPHVRHNNSDLNADERIDQLASAVDTSEVVLHAMLRDMQEGLNSMNATDARRAAALRSITEGSPRVMEKPAPPRAALAEPKTVSSLAPRCAPPRTAVVDNLLELM
eukprot:Sspe_Gene.34269::Locus_16678_Transcript_1_7_Confidence_0.154_Length_1469::g.34269::m.34269